MRFLLMHHGEDRELCMKQFWEEHNGDYAVVPIVAYGFVPRRALCTQRSFGGRLANPDTGKISTPDGYRMVQMLAVLKFVS